MIAFQRIKIADSMTICEHINLVFPSRIMQKKFKFNAHGCRSGRFGLRIKCALDVLCVGACNVQVASEKWI